MQFIGEVLLPVMSWRLEVVPERVKVNEGQKSRREGKETGEI